MHKCNMPIQRQQLMAHRNNNASNSDQHLSSVIDMRVDPSSDMRYLFVCVAVGIFSFV